MKIGKLYKMNNFIWSLFPTKKVAEKECFQFPIVGYPIPCPINHVDGLGRNSETISKTVAKNQSINLNCNVVATNNTTFLLLEEDGMFLKILSSDNQVGWIIAPKVYQNNFEEII